MTHLTKSDFDEEWANISPMAKDTMIIVYWLDQLREYGIVTDGTWRVTAGAKPFVEEVLATGYQVSDKSIITFVTTQMSTDIEAQIAFINLLHAVRADGIASVVQKTQQGLGEVDPEFWETESGKEIRSKLFKDEQSGQ